MSIKKCFNLIGKSITVYIQEEIYFNICENLK